MILKKINACHLAIKTGSITINNSESVFKKLSELQEKNSFFAIFSLKPVASTEHIVFAAEQMLSAFENESNYSNKKEIELLLRLTGKHKIEDALELMELQKGKNSVALIGIGENKIALQKKLNQLSKELYFVEEKNAVEKNLAKNKPFIKKLFKIDEKINALNDLNEKQKINELVLEKIALIGVSD